MHRVHTFIDSLCCEVVHTARFQMKLNLDVAGLAEEVERRGRDVNWGYKFKIERDSKGVNCYNVTVPKIDALDSFFKIVQTIEDDVEKAREAKRLLGFICL